jgi:predicted secreted protein
MTWFTGIIVYVLVWWVALFAVLPLLVTPAEPDVPGYPARRNGRGGC